MLSEKIFTILEQNDMQISDKEERDGEYYRDLQFYSPLGEDFHITVIYDGTEVNFIESFKESAENFDADEHAEMWINARGTVEGVPRNIRDLIDDAEHIKAFLLKVTDELQDYKLPYNEYKCTITVTDGTEERTQDFYVEAKSLEKVVKLIEKQLQIEF